MCAVVSIRLFRKADTPEFWQDTTDVSLLRHRILGAYLRWLLGGASVDLCVKYVNDLDTPIHKRTCARRSKLRRLRKA